MHSFFFRSFTHDSFTFNSQLFYELKHKVHLSKSVCGIFHFRFRLVFIKVYLFIQQKAWTLVFIKPYRFVHELFDFKTS